MELKPHSQGEYTIMILALIVMGIMMLAAFLIPMRKDHSYDHEYQYDEYCYDYSSDKTMSAPCPKKDAK